MIKPELMKLLPRTGIILLIGRRGSGKSLCAHSILESLHTNRECFVYNFPKEDILPPYIQVTNNMEFKDNSVVLVDEGYMNFSARKGMSENNKFIDNLNGLARQKDLLIIYITQEAARIDVNIVRGIEVLLVKTLSINQVRFERKEMRTFLSKVKDMYSGMSIEDKLSSVYVSCDTLYDSYEGFMVNAISPPSYWNDEISRAWAGVSLDGKNGKNTKVNECKTGTIKKKTFTSLENVCKIEGNYYLIDKNGERIRKLA